MVPQVLFRFVFAHAVVYPWALCSRVIIVTVDRSIVDVSRSSEYVILVSTSTSRGGGARDEAWATDGDVVVTGNSDSLLSVVTTSSSRIGVEGVFMRDWK